MQDNLVEVIVTKSKQIYPKTIHRDGDFGIVSCKVSSVNIGENILVIHPIYDTITIKGAMCTMKDKKKYKVIGTQSFDPTYKSYSIDIGYIDEYNENINIEDFEGYLKYVMTESEFEKISQLDNLKEVLENKDIDTLVTVKGIGKKKAETIIKKYTSNKQDNIYRAKLAAYGVTEGLMNRLKDKYNSYEAAINKIEENYYLLAEDEIHGLGFKTVDNMALKSGIAETDARRIRGYIVYLLKTGLSEGKSYLPTSFILNSIYNDIFNNEVTITKEELGMIFAGLFAEEVVWRSEDKQRLALEYARDIEDRLSKEIMRLYSSKPLKEKTNWKKVVKEIEKEQGWEYTHQQLEAIKQVMTNNFVLITGYAGCVDCDTEFFNGVEWKKISEYKKGDKVLQYNMDRTASLVYPKDYVKKQCEEMTLLKTTTGAINQCLSDEHNVVYVTSKGNITKKPFYEVKKMHLSTERGFTGKFISAFDYEGEGIDLTPEQIRVMIMVIADGHFNKRDNSGWCILHIKKQRKKERARLLLEQAGIEYKESERANGYSDIRFYAPRLEKKFEPYWYNCNKEQLKIVCDEVLHWDGNTTTGRDRYGTVVKSDADFVQFAFTSLGKRTIVHTRNRVGQSYKDKASEGYIRKNLEYEVHISKKAKLLSIMGDDRNNYKNKATMTPYKTKDGYKYCFEVDSGMLVLRREGRIFITGNTGKSSVLKPMTRVLVESQGKDISQCALSGKAANRIEEVTGYEAKTIHRLLNYSPQKGFVFNKNNQLETDIVVLDEASMTDAVMALRLLEAIETGTKVILLGDTGQLPCIGQGSLLLDLINSCSIPCIQLDIIHRQAQASGIVSTSANVRNKKPVVPFGFEGEKILGELKDLKLDISSEKETLPEKVIEYFKKELDKHKDIMQVAVITATTTRGKLSALNINKMIKNVYNPIKDGDEAYIKVDIDKNNSYLLSIGDKILVTKNNYKAKIYNETKKDFEEGAIYNGNVGIVTDIKENAIEVDISGIGKVLIEDKHYNTIQLGYAITCHKSQGSEYKSIIVAIDMSAYMLLSTEWLYTAITRAKQYCIIVADPQALNRACSHQLGNTKTTFLQEFLEIAK